MGIAYGLILILFCVIFRDILAVFTFFLFQALPLAIFAALIYCIIKGLLFLKSKFTSTLPWNLTTAITAEVKAKGYIFVWKIENLSNCLLKKEACIKSPVFTTNALNGTKWSLRMFPKGVKNDNLVTVFLKRKKDYYGPDVIQVKYQITFLDKDGLILDDKPIWEGCFEREITGFFPACRRRGKVFGRERKTFILEDNLIVQCKLWKKDEKPAMSELKSAFTTYKVHRKSFVWNIDKFSTRPTRKSKFTDGVISFDLFLHEGLSYEKKLYIDILPCDGTTEFFSFIASIVDSKGRKIKCGNPIYSHGDLKKGMPFKMFFTRNLLMENRNQYLPNDVLSFDCQCVYSIASTSYHKNDVPQKDIIKEKLKVASSLWNGSKFMCKNATMELRTSTQTFLAHRAILMARSSTFRKILITDKSIGYIDITDFDDETVRKVLTYLYTDSLGDLQIKSASKLYTAAIKYGILTLKRRCSSFMKDNLNPSAACDVLVLAYKNQDRDLKSAVQLYIMKHYKEVLGTQEWAHLMSTHPQLAANMMYSKIFKK